MTTILHLHLSFGPACGRQLSGHRPDRAQIQDTMESGDWVAFKSEMIGKQNAQRDIVPGKYCRWCARAVGLLPPVHRRVRDEQDDESEADRAIDRDLAEQELEDELEDES